MRIKLGNRKWVLIALLVILGLAAGTFLSQRVQATGETYANLKVFTEVLSLVENNYVDDVNAAQLIEGAIKGMLRTLDAHTSYMPPDLYKEMQVETEGTFGGLGIEITIRDDQLTVVAPIEGTPAYRAGVKPGDRILRVQGESTKDMSLLDAVKKMRGPTGTEVTISIFREGLEEPMDITLTREVIQIKSVKEALLTDEVGYIKVRNFHKSTGEEVEAALKNLEAQGMKSLVLDLRNNPGGLLDQAVEVSDRFLEGGKLIVYTKGRVKNQNMRFNSQGDRSHTEFPMIVLVNGGSASASEIVAGALQDYRRAVILGTQTFGKGSVQTIIPLSDGSGLRLTTSRYYTPLGRIIQDKGISPDIVVEAPTAQPLAEVPEPAAEAPESAAEEPTGEGAPDESEGAVEELPTNGEDAEFRDLLQSDVQVQRAVELLKGWEILFKTQPVAHAT